MYQKNTKIPQTRYKFTFSISFNKYMEIFKFYDLTNSYNRKISKSRTVHKYIYNIYKYNHNYYRYKNTKIPQTRCKFTFPIFSNKYIAKKYPYDRAKFQNRCIVYKYPPNLVISQLLSIQILSITIQNTTKIQRYP